MRARVMRTEVDLPRRRERGCRQVKTHRCSLNRFKRGKARLVGAQVARVCEVCPARRRVAATRSPTSSPALLDPWVPSRYSQAT